jgi:uncharacterized membrane protein YhaH (DUF805 family)
MAKMNAVTFTKLTGRIDRKTWWLGMVIVVAVSFVLYFLLNAVFGVEMMSMTREKLLDPGYLESYMKSAAQQQLITLAIFSYPITAVMSKRLNDRDRPWWFVWMFWLPTIAGIFIALLGLGYAMVDIDGVKVPLPTTLGWIVNILTIALSLWALIEMGFLRGTDGANQHGPDPIAD